MKADIMFGLLVVAAVLAIGFGFKMVAQKTFNVAL